MKGVLASLDALKVLAVTFVGMLFVDTLGAITQAGKAQLPSPRRYLATFLLWGILGMVAATSPRAARASAQLALLVLTTAAVAGPFGKRLVGFLNKTAHLTSDLGAQNP